ncbi:MFS transporter [Siminovitchia sp. FSL H7-0308]|uniref:MFS transporter n=1 Tax=Siminovitchia sp. FSL H7-0308 TaxID=2921432 RepID=UPI0030EF56B0
MSLYQLIRANSNFRLTWFAMFVSRLGDGLYSVAIIWMTYQVDRSALSLGIVLGAFTFSTFVFGIFAGVVADRMNRRTLIISSSVLCGVTVLVIPLTFYFGMLHLPLLVFLSFVFGALTQFFEPVVRASVSNLVSKTELTQGNAALGTTESIGYLVGPTLGGILITFFNVEMVLVLNGISFLLAALLISKVNVPLNNMPEAISPTKWTHDLKEGLQFIKENQFVTRLFQISILSTIAYSPFFVNLPIFLDEGLKLSSKEQATFLGILYSILSLGQLIGFWLIGYVPDRIRVNLTIGYLLQAIGFGLLFVLSHPVAIMLSVTVAGISFGLVSAPFYSAIQREVPGRLHGRVFGVQSTFNGLLLPAGRTITGGALEFVNARSIFLFMGVLYFLNAFLANLLSKEK